MRSKKHDVFAVMLHNRRVVNGLHRIGNLLFGKDRIVRVPPDDVCLHAVLLASVSRMVAYTRSYCCTIDSTEKNCFTRCLHALRTIRGTRSRQRAASSTPVTRKP